jgi:hypothetical protein
MTFVLTGGKISGLLEVGEVFINNKHVSKVVMIKYPKIGQREYYAARNVSLKEIYRRIEKEVFFSRITEEEGNILKDYFKCHDKSIAMMPASSVTANACAGLDYDYDGGVFIEYTEITEGRELTKKEELTNQIVDIMFSECLKAVILQNEE